MDTEKIEPLTKSTVNVKIANKPILEHIINRLKTQGFINIIISTLQIKKIINYFKMKNLAKFKLC